LDFQKTFIHVAKWSTIHCFVPLAIQHGWEILYMDVKSTLFNGLIKKDVYVKHHCGFIVPDLEDKVCKLKRALYKLGQCPWAQHEKIYVFLQKPTLVLCLTNPNLYIFQEDGLIFALAI